MPSYKYPKADNTVDAVVFSVDMKVFEKEQGLKILLIMRGRQKEPFYGHWALPGGFINMEEDLEESCLRELREETGLEPTHMQQLKTFGAPGRDPRGRVISTAFLALVQTSKVQGGDDAKKALWWPVADLPPLAFDHADILTCGLAKLREEVSQGVLGTELLPSEFTLTELQRVHELVLGIELDKRNFRRKMLALGVLEKVDGTGKRNAEMYSLARR